MEKNQVNNCKEEKFIEYLRYGGKFVQIYLIPGVKMIGKIVGDDDNAIFISSPDGEIQMIYKSSITTISNYKGDI